MIGPALAIAVLASSPTEAFGSSFRVDEDTNRIIYAADRGERNDVTVRAEQSHGAGEDLTLVVEDVVPIRLGAGCDHPVPDDPRSARCIRDYFRFYTVELRLGDANDRARAVGENVTTIFRGGSGADTLIGGAGGDVFVGGPGDDRMSGGANRDRFVEDRPTNGDDTLRGGTDYGGDSVDYGRRRGAIRADLDGERDDGGRGEADLIGTDVETVIGGRGDDHLTGNRDDNMLVGGAGVDRLAGRGGSDRLVADEPSPGDGYYRVTPRRLWGARSTDDRLYGGSGSDELIGSAWDNALSGGPAPDFIDAGQGRDRIRDRDGVVDFAGCGVGRDVMRNDRFDFLDSCERTDALSDAPAVPIVIATVSRVSGDPRIEVVLGCRLSPSRRCAGTLHVEVDGQRVGQDAELRLRGGTLGIVAARDSPLESEIPPPGLTVVIRFRSATGRVTRSVTPASRLQTVLSGVHLADRWPSRNPALLRDAL